MKKRKNKITKGSLGIDYMQGYLIGKPQPLHEILQEQVPEILAPVEALCGDIG